MSSSICSPASGPRRTPTNRPRPPESRRPTTSRPVADGAADGAADAGEDADASEDGESDESPFRRRDAELTPLIVASARKLKRVLADEQNEVLDGLRRATGTAVLPARDAAHRRASPRPSTTSCAPRRAPVRRRSPPVVRPSSTSRQMTSTIGAGHDALTEWFVNPLRERLERSLADGAGDNEAIAKGIRAVYREWKTQHIDEQLDDVLRTAHGRAVLAALPDGAPVCWGVDAEHPACADGDDNALAGCVAAGTPFPTGHLFAPSHTGCRCLLVPADQ